MAKRPDVLVIESGEIQLPGDVSMKNIGLPKNVAYACLAETIVLALEGRFENFTVGRAIEWEKVREIYQLGLKHGMKLAAISGVNGVFRRGHPQGARAGAGGARRGRPGRGGPGARDESEVSQAREARGEAGAAEAGHGPTREEAGGHPSRESGGPRART